MWSFTQITGGDRKILALIILSVFVIVVAVLVSVFTCLAINEDAKAKGIKSRVLFAVLGFFFPLIAAIVYLIVRNNLKRIQPKICNRCGLTLDSSYNLCPQCGSSEFTYYLIPDADKYSKRAKTSAIVALVSYVVVLIISLVMQFSGLFYTSNFARDNNSYNYNNGYQYNGDSDKFDDDNDSDYDDFFNQFGDGNDGQSDSETPIQ